MGKNDEDPILKMFEGLSLEEANELVDDTIAAIVRGDEEWQMSKSEAAEFIQDMVRALVEYKAQQTKEIELQKE